MGYNTQDAVWPEHPVPLAVKALIDRFFNLLDSKDSNVGDILADEIFAPDAKAQFGAHAATGSEEIRRSRDSAWNLFTSRKHLVKRVYSFDDKATDLLFIAYGDMELKNGEQVAAEFVGRLTLEHTETESPKLKSYNIWGDSAALVKALQKR